MKNETKTKPNAIILVIFANTHLTVGVATAGVNVGWVVSVFMQSGQMILGG